MYRQGVFGLAIAGDMSILRDMEQTVTGVIESIDRLTNTKSGNPRYEITLDNGESYLTYPNANFAHALTGREDGKTATLTIGRRACIESIVFHH